MMMNKEGVFIFTICYNCGLILKKALETFFEFNGNEYKVHIFGTNKDFKHLKDFSDKNIEFIDLSTNDNLRDIYKNGHLGTAYILSNVLLNKYGEYKKIIHFDSDVIFRDECLSDILSAFDNGYDLIGQRRSYEKNKCGRGDLIGYPDLIGTCFFGANIEKISKYEFSTLHRMVVGYYSPHNIPILDFFDPVSFDIIKNGGKVKCLESKEYGSSDENGNWDNGFDGLNNMMDFGSKMIHFAGIGSGMNFYYNGNGSVPNSYAEWAKGRFSLYMKIFYDENIDFEYDQEIYNKIKLIL